MLASLRPAGCRTTLKRYISTLVRMDATSYVPKFVPAEPGGNLTVSRRSISFRIVSYNILAQAYVKSILFPHSPPSCLKWKNRSQKVVSRLLSFDADLLCIQELDEFESFYKPQLESKGYSSIYIQRGGKKRDGCGIFYRPALCELLDSVFIDYNDLVPPSDGEARTAADEDEDDRNVMDPRIRLRRNCVGILAAFRHSQCEDQLILVANTHLYWDPQLADVKLAQAKYLLWRLVQFKKDMADKYRCKLHVLVAGDFNSTPGDPVYNYLTSGRRGEVHAPDADAVKDSKAPSIPLESLYATVQGEPPFTNFTPGFTGTLDYVFFSPSKQLRATTFLELPSPDSAEVLGGLPNHIHPSDHLAIGADFSVLLP